MKQKINHPMADTISIISGRRTYSSETFSELAFFYENDWVINALPEFSEYHDGSPSSADTAVYTWVPNKIIAEFLVKYVV